LLAVGTAAGAEAARVLQAARDLARVLPCPALERQATDLLARARGIRTPSPLPAGGW
jgi:hypothetical protein